MATIERQLISQTHWRTDGVTTNFSFSFLNGYISQQHIKCRLRDPVSGLEQAVTPVRGTSSVSITPAPANGWLLVIYRDTPFTPLVNFSDTTSLDEEDLTLLVRQAMFAAQEARDWSDSQLARFAEGLSGDNQLTVQLLALVEQAQAALTQATQVAAGVTADAAGIEASANQVQASANDALAARGDANAFMDAAAQSATLANASSVDAYANRLQAEAAALSAQGAAVLATAAKDTAAAIAAALGAGGLPGGSGGLTPGTIFLNDEVVLFEFS